MGMGSSEKLLLKGEDLINARAGRLLAAVALGTLPFGIASAQSRAPQPAAKDAGIHQQSTNQIVGVPQTATDARPSAAIQSQKTQQPEVEAEFENAVIPPAPIIIKRNPNAISIPVDGSGSPSKLNSEKPNSESKYDERPVVASSVSVGSVFGYRRDPFTGRAKFHSGVDLKARWGDPVGASQAGVVQFAGWYHGYGNMIIIAHGGGVATHYAHLSSFDVEVGTHVERGTIIGRAGSTGRATSPHLHYELRFEGNALSPFQPLALDSTSDYFKQLRPTVDAGRSESTSIAAPLREK